MPEQKTCGYPVTVPFERADGSTTSVAQACGQPATGFSAAFMMNLCDEHTTEMQEKSRDPQVTPL